MSANVLFDAPGPATRARHRVYTVVGTVVLLAVLGFALYRLYDTEQFQYAFWEPFLTPDYIKAILEGVRDTVTMAVFSVLGAVVFGLVFGLGKLSDHAVIRWPSWLVVEFFRAMPVLLMMVFLYLTYFISVEYSFLYIDSNTFGGFITVVIALTLYNGAVLAEVFRAGINAVPKGQAEAAYALGLSKTQVVWMIQLPQAVKIMLPAIISQMVVALKDTSLGYAVLAPGLTYVGDAIRLEFNNHVPTVIVISAIYIVLNLILTWIATWVQRRFVGEKRIDLAAAATGGQDAAQEASRA